VIHAQPIPVSATTMIHSFAITERDVIFWELPVVFSLEAAINGAANPFSWEPDYGARLGVLPLGGDASEIRWVEIDPCYVFHELNAYRAGDEIVIDVCRHDRMFDHNDLNDTMLTVRALANRHRRRGAVFPRRGGGERGIRAADARSAHHGRVHRYGWFVTTREHPTPSTSPAPRWSTTRPGASAGGIRAPNRHAGEAFFVAG
jgi:carotenoid cleavage dioxygenase